MSKRKPRDNALDRAHAVLSERFDDVERGRDCLWVGRDAYLKRLPRRGRLVLRFREGADEALRLTVAGSLRAVSVEYELASAYRVDEGGDVLAVDQGAEDTRWLGRAGRDPHVRVCLTCKELLDQCAVADGEYVEGVRKFLARHAKEKPAGHPAGPKCDYTGCVRHEDVGRELALAMVRIGGGDDPWRDVRGVQVSTVGLRPTARNHPEGWDFKRGDATHRLFTRTPAAADIYVRLGPRKTTVHLWIGPPLVSRHETAEDAATVEDVVETYEKRAPAIIAWSERQYGALKELARTELEKEDS